jgi:hypothetical protein
MFKGTRKSEVEHFFPIRIFRAHAEIRDLQQAVYEELLIDLRTKKQIETLI